jgi:hypothetical protein
MTVDGSSHGNLIEHLMLYTLMRIIYNYTHIRI